MNPQIETRPRLNVLVQRADTEAAAPHSDFLEHCARQALPAASGELVIRLVDEAESAALNERYLGKAGATNVLAFPAGDIPGASGLEQPLGDIAICGAIVGREAATQQKSPEAHWAHMVVHGCLHIIGFDHQNESDAAAMESSERTILLELGFEDPYHAEA